MVRHNDFADFLKSSTEVFFPDLNICPPPSFVAAVPKLSKTVPASSIALLEQHFKESAAVSIPNKGLKQTSVKQAGMCKRHNRVRKRELLAQIMSNTDPASLLSQIKSFNSEFKASVRRLSSRWSMDDVMQRALSNIGGGRMTDAEKDFVWVLMAKISLLSAHVDGIPQARTCLDFLYDTFIEKSRDPDKNIATAIAVERLNLKLKEVAIDRKVSPDIVDQCRDVVMQDSLMYRKLFDASLAYLLNVSDFEFIASHVESRIPTVQVSYENRKWGCFPTLK